TTRGADRGGRPAPGRRTPPARRRAHRTGCGRDGAATGLRGPGERPGERWPTGPGRAVSARSRGRHHAERDAHDRGVVVHGRALALPEAAVAGPPLVQGGIAL